MKNIILLPLDERPCNFDFPSKIFNGEKYTIIRPEHLGQKKTPASYEFIRDFLSGNGTVSGGGSSKPNPDGGGSDGDQGENPLG